MERFVIFYALPTGDCDSVYIHAADFEDACSISDHFNSQSGYTILGVCPEHLLKFWFYGK